MKVKNIEKIIPALGIFYAWSTRFTDYKTKLTAKQKELLEEQGGILDDANAIVDMIIDRRQEDNLNEQIGELKSELQ